MLTRESIVESIVRFVEQSEANDLRTAEKEPIFDRPLVGFSSGADSLYDFYRQHIGDFYKRPVDFLRETFAEYSADEGEVTVISWILPSTARTRAEQAKRRKQPSERWVRTRTYGEEFNNLLRSHVAGMLAANDIYAVAPLLSPLWKRSEEGPYAPCSNWSERHAAYAAGLGTFGLCDGLITPVGKAMRTGSVIAALRLAPSSRADGDHRAGCLHFSQGSCGQCIDRCPVGALSELGHDKKKCMRYTERAMHVYIRKKFGIETYACGLCQCDVPCMDHVPRPEEG